ncbi:MAG TPA: transglycosylase SLT domain-containing protein [Gammaproteobacteria bacterium]
MKRLALSCALLSLAACAAAPRQDATAPAPATSMAPAAATTYGLGTDSATPIPDLADGTDTGPDVQWSDVTLTPAEEPKYDDLWDYLARHFTLQGSGIVSDARVQGELTWFAAHGEYLNRVAGRARPYLHYIVQQVEAHKMPLDIALLPVVESAFDPFAYSYGRASGLWQFVPATGNIYELKQDWWYDGRRDVAASTQAALDYLQALHNEFDGDWLLALAAYNSGPGTVERAIALNKRRGKPTDFWNLELPAETRAYVPRLMAICKLVADPKHMGVDLAAIPNQPYLTQVDAGGQIDLATAAKLAGITTEQMYLLNPGYSRWATDPAGPYLLFVPLDSKETFQEGLAALPPHDRIQWATHKVGKGDTIGGVAAKAHTTVAVLKELNGLRSNLLHVNQTLLVPVSRQTLAAASVQAQQQRIAGITDLHLPGGRILHKVKDGESLWVIAQHYHVTVNDIRQWNKISTRHVLHKGDRLVIYGGRRVNSGS